MTKTFKYKLSGLFIGIVFGFLLQKGGVTDYNILMGQLLLEDFTVFKIIISAVITGIVGLYFLKSKNIINYHLKKGTALSLVTGGLIFGIGFGLLGYCPGTLAGAVGQGSLDALLTGIPGIILGSAFYAELFPKINNSFFEKKQIKKIRLTEYFNKNEGFLIALFSAILLLFLLIIEIIS